MSSTGSPDRDGSVVLYAAVSLDGYLAGPADDLSFLDDVAAAGSTYEAFYAGVSALLMGRRTYEVARSVPHWPYPGLPCTVVTSRPLDDPPPEVQADPGDDLPALVHSLRRHGRVWLVGGGQLASALLDQGLLDELDLTLTPHLLGGGSALWQGRTGRHRLDLASTAEVGAGAVRLRYRVGRA
jgi:dihydrofolate reductase